MKIYCVYFCEFCGEQFQRDRRGSHGSPRFCSRPCVARGIVAGKNKKDPVSIECVECGDSFLSPPSQVDRRVTCSHKCLAAKQSRERKGVFQQGKDHPLYKNGISLYRQFRKDACEECGSTKNLDCHHKDHDRTNNTEENIETLCRSCHKAHHQKRDLKSGRFVA